MRSHTIRELARAVRNGQTTSRVIVDTCLEAIASRNTELNAFITVLGEEARARASLADHELASGIDLGPLHGIPISVKDLLDLEGVATTAASRVREGHRATADAPVLARLRAAGAVFVGKTNLHEFAFGTTGDDSAFGPIRNPHAPDRMAGGSSSGSAVSVAAGMATASVGTDTGGSIRIPAAACGVVGLKPTYGELSCEGVVPLGTTLDHVGPLGRTVDDVATVYRAMAGVETVGGASTRRHSPAQLALPRPYFLEVLDDEVRERFERALDRLRKAGCLIIDVDLPGADEIGTTYRTTVLYEALRVHRSTLETQSSDYSPAVRKRLESGRDISDTDYQKAQQVRETLGQGVDAALASRDALVLPTLPIPAPILGTKHVTLGTARHDIRTLTLRLTQLFDLTGHPAISLPIGPTSGGLPCGMQLVGRRGETGELLQLAASYEDTF